MDHEQLELQTAKIKKRDLQKLIDSENIADDLEESELREISQKVLDELRVDEQHPLRKKKIEKWEEGLKVAEQVIEAKSTPWENASNVKYPILSVASIQFYARAYPAIVTGGGVVKQKMIGKASPEKEKKGKNAVTFMNYQLMDEMNEWEPDTAKLLLQLPLYGVMYRKMMFSGAKKRTVSKLLSPLKLIVPATASSVKSAQRVSELFEITGNEIEGRIRNGTYRRFEYQVASENADTDCLHDFVEQHRYLDLDDDGFKEPYIVTVHKKTEEIARIEANFTMDDVHISKRNQVSQVDKQDFYIDYTFLPSLDASCFGTGFFDILYPLTDVINTNINQLLDAGSLANSSSGWIGKELRIGKNDMKFKVGEYKSVNARGMDIRSGIVPMQFPGPSGVLFNLLGFIVEAARDVANIKDVLTGEGLGANASPTTTMALIEEGSKVYSAIYKSIHRSLAQEFQLLKKINAKYLDPYIYKKILDEPIGPHDFSDEEVDFSPISDPTIASGVQKMARSQYIAQFINDPFFNQMELRKRMLESAEVPDIEKLLQPPPEGPTHEQQMEEQRLKNETLKLQLEIMRLEKEAERIDSQVIVDKTTSIKNLAQAESLEAGDQLNRYETHMRMIDSENNVGGVSGMEGSSGNESGGGIPQEAPAGDQGLMGNGVL